MRVLFVSDVHYPWTKGGSELRISKMVEYLLSQGHEVDVLCGKWWEGDAPEHLIGVPFNRRIYRGGRSTMSALSFTLSAAREMPRLRGRYDIVEFNMSPMLHLSLIGLARRMPALRSAKMVGMLHEAWQEYWFEYAGLVAGAAGYLLEHHAVFSLDRVITISEFNRRRFERWGVDPDRVSVIRPGVDIGTIGASPPSPTTSDLIFVGRLVRDHRVDLLVEAVRCLKERGRTVRLVVVGGGPELDALRSQATRQEVSEQIIFTGLLESHREVYGLMKSSKVFVFPSAPHGGWSIACVEGNAAGLPIVTVGPGEIGTPAELVQTHANGLVAREHTAESMAESIETLLDHGEVRQTMSVESVRSASRYDWPVVCEQTSSIYAELIGVRSGATAIRGHGRASGR